MFYRTDSDNEVSALDKWQVKKKADYYVKGYTSEKKLTKKDKKGALEVFEPLLEVHSLTALDEEREEAALEAKEALTTLREMVALRWKGIDTMRFVQSQMLVCG